MVYHKDRVEDKVKWCLDVESAEAAFGRYAAAIRVDRLGFPGSVRLVIVPPLN